jgi:3-hydroxybutyryl-CoA dehydrogenase
VDKAVTLTLGRRYTATGPMESADMGGLDIFSKVLAELCPVLCSRTGPGPLVEAALQAGHLGMKSGQGIQAWPPETIAARRNDRERSLMDFLKQG